MARSARQPDGSQADLPEAVFLIYFCTQGHDRQGRGKHVSLSKLSGLSRVGNVLSDPPALQNVMEAEAKCLGLSPPTCSHPR